jgi:hypothetical protein
MWRVQIERQESELVTWRRRCDQLTAEVSEIRGVLTVRENEINSLTISIEKFKRQPTDNVSTQQIELYLS